MSKDSYMFLRQNKANIWLLIKEGRKATFTTAICSLISQTVQYTILKKYTILQKYTVWDHKQQTVLVNITSLTSFMYGLMVATIHSQNMELSFDI